MVIIISASDIRRTDKIDRRKLLLIKIFKKKVEIELLISEYKNTKYTLF